MIGEATEFLGVSLSAWGVIGTWVASIGTVGAVIVSLWLAHNQNKSNLRVSIERIGYKDIDMVSYEACYIHIVNKTRMPAHIAEIGWQVGPRKKPYFSSAQVEDMPTILTAGQGTKCFLRFYDIIMGGHVNDNNLKKNNIKALLNDLKPLYVVVRTATGEQFKGEVSNSMIKEFIGFLREKNGLDAQT